MKKEKSQMDNLTLHLNELAKEEQKRPKVSRRKEIIKIKEEINKIETQKQQRKLIKPRAGSLKRSTKLTNPWPDSFKRGEKEPKSPKLEMKKEKSQRTLQKYEKP